MNLFEQAITKGELLKFALGKDEYYIADRDYDDHSVLISWTNYVLPLIGIKGIDYVNEKIEAMILELLNSDLDARVKNENLLYHLHVYYYMNSEGRIKATKLSSLNKKIADSINAYMDLLKTENDPKENAFQNTINLKRSLHK